MPAFTVEKSIVIAAPCGVVYPLVRNLQKWNEWSPWLVAEPDAKVTFSKKPDGYAWDGRVIGSGSIEVLADEPGKSMDCRLVFLKPWKSECSFRFEFRETHLGTEVKWTMQGTLPFFLFFMKPTMTAMIGMDYERGLKMLSDLAEKGAVPSKLEFLGETGYPGCRYVGVKRECNATEIGALMKSDMEMLGNWLEDSKTKAAGPPFSVYEKWEIATGEATYVVGFPVSEVPRNLPTGMMSGKLQGCPVYRVKHTGAYRHLGNAWAAGMMRGRAKVFSQSKRVPPFEIYETDPTSGVEEKDLITMVCFPERRA